MLTEEGQAQRRIKAAAAQKVNEKAYALNQDIFMIFISYTPAACRLIKTTDRAQPRVEYTIFMLSV